jgi:molybdate transport system regulatory protein
MGITYRHAWDLIDQLNNIFGCPVVEPRHGGSGGGGATLSAKAIEIVRRYRSIEASVAKVSRADVAALEKLVSP